MPRRRGKWLETKRQAGRDVPLSGGRGIACYLDDAFEGGGDVGEICNASTDDENFPCVRTDHEATEMKKRVNDVNTHSSDSGNRGEGGGEGGWGGGGQSRGRGRGVKDLRDE